VLGIALAVTAGVEFGIVEMTVLETNVSPLATWIFVGSLFGAYLLSQRNIGDLSDWEIGAFIVGLGGYAGMVFVPAVNEFVTTNQPYTGAGLTIVTMVAFYVLTNENI
jgi:hypothetical protein